MDKRTFAEEVTRTLCRGLRVVCALGTIETRVYAGYAGRNPRTGAIVPVPSKRLPYYRPSDAFLSQAFGVERVPAAFYERGAPPPGAVHAYALGAAEDLPAQYLEEGDGSESPEPIGESIALDVGALAGDIAATLGAGKRFGISGFGTFGARRLKRRRLDVGPETIVADADLCGKIAIYVAFSAVLKDALNRAPPT